MSLPMLQNSRSGLIGSRLVETDVDAAATVNKYDTKKTSNCIVQVKYIYEPNTWNPKRSATVLPTYTHPREGIREAGIFIVLVNVSTSKPVRPTQDETNIHCPHWYESGWNNGHCTRPFNEWMNLFSSFRCGMRRYLQDWWQSSRM